MRSRAPCHRDSESGTMREVATSTTGTPHRPSACATSARRSAGSSSPSRGDRVTSIRGNDADPLSRGYICPKGVSLADIHADPDRLRRPVRRVGDGADAEWVEIGWDEALDLVADRLAGDRSTEHGRNAVGVYLGNPSAHSLGSATHGVPFVQVPAHPQPVQRLVGRPDPAPVRGLAAVRPPAAAADPRHRPHVVLPGLRRQPDGLQRLADDGARLPEPAARPQGARRPDGGASTRAAPRPPRSPPSTTSCGPGTDAVVLLAMLQRAVRGGPDPPAGVRRQRGRGRGRWSPSSPPSGPRQVSGVPADDDPPDHARVRRRPTARRRTAGWASRPTGSARSASGRSSCLNLLTGNFDRDGRGAVPRARDRRGRPPDHRARATTTSGGAGCASCPEFAGELPVVDAAARRSRRRATARSARC